MMLDIFKKKGKKIINESKAILSELIPGQKAFVKSIAADCFGIERFWPGILPYLVPALVST